MLSQEQLAEIQKALEAATPGPWDAIHHSNEVSQVIRRKSGSIAYDLEPSDANLIANAPTWIQQLLETVKAKDAEIAKLSSVNHTLSLTVGELDKARAKYQDEVRVKDAEIEQLKAKLDAKLTFINNGWEEERYVLQEENERLKHDYAVIKKAHEISVNDLISAANEYEQAKTSLEIAVDALKRYANQEYWSTAHQYSEFGKATVKTFNEHRTAPWKIAEEALSRINSKED